MLNCWCFNSNNQTQKNIISKEDKNNDIENVGRQDLEPETRISFSEGFRRAEFEFCGGSSCRDILTKN